MTKISWVQFATMLAVSRLFSEAMNFPLRSAEYSMQRFTIILIAKAVLFIIYIPLILFARKYEGQSVISVMSNRCKPLAWIYGGLLVLLLTSASILTVSKVEFYTTSTIFSTAPSVLLIALIVLICGFAVWKGIQATARMSVLVTVALVVLIIVVGASVSNLFDFSFLYSNFLEKPNELFSQVLVEIEKNTEIYVFLVLMEFVRNKPQRSVYFSIPAIFILIEALILMEVLVFGPYLSQLNFPFFVLSALSDVIIFQRLDGIDVAIWTLISVIKLSLYALSAKTIVTRLVNEKAGSITAAVMLTVIGVLAVYISSNRELLSYASNHAANAVILVVIVAVVPLIMLFLKKRKGTENVEKSD